MEAFLALEGIYKVDDNHYIKNAQPSQEYALWLLYYHQYDEAKEKIILPIDQFISSLNDRITKNILDHQNKLEKQFQKIYILFIIAYIIFFIIAVIINKKILAPIEALTKTISAFRDGKDILRAGKKQWLH